MDGTDTGPGDSQDLKGQGNPPENEEGTRGDAEQETPAPKPTITEEERNAAIHAALTKAGRDAKALEAREAVLKAREAEHERWQQERDQAEVDAVADNPAQMDVVKERQKIRQEKAQLARDKAEHAAALAEAQESKREVAIFNIASTYGLDAAELKDLGLTPEATEKVAKVMAAKLKATPKAEPKAPFKPDSGRVAGKGGKLTDEERSKMTVEEVANHPETKARFK